MKTELFVTAEERGLCVVPLGEAWAKTPDVLRADAEGSPYAFATRVLGVEPLLVERQPIRPALGGRSFASTRIDTPLHTDSQMLLGVPAAFQILVCVHRASHGGESTFVDGLELARTFEREAPEVFRAMHDVDRVQRFYFGEVRGPTVARRGGHWTWTFSPNTNRAADDHAGRALDAAVERVRPSLETLVALCPGDVLVASNHRMLHGRRPFDGERELVRLLVWLESPLAVPSHVTMRAREVTAPLPPSIVLSLRSVFRILRGVAPAKVASDAAVDEATLYAWRDAFVRDGAAALAK